MESQWAGLRHGAAMQEPGAHCLGCQQLQPRPHSADDADILNALSLSASDETTTRRSRGVPMAEIEKFMLLRGDLRKNNTHLLVHSRWSAGRTRPVRASVVDVVICMSANKKIKFVAMTDDSSTIIFEPKPKTKGYLWAKITSDFLSPFIGF